MREDVGWGRAVRCGGSLWLLATSAYLGIAALAGALGTERSHFAGTPPAAWPARVYLRFDAAHFLGIARNGYFGPHASRVAPAYFPGLPELARAVARLIAGGSPGATAYLVALTVVSWSGAVTAAVLLWRLTALRSGPAVATRAVLVLVAGPYSVFLVAPYSEGPFLALALAAWLAARADRWLLAACFSSLAAVTRISGVFLGCGLVVAYVLAHRRGARVRAWDVLALTGPFLVVAGYFAWLHSRTGSWATWFRVERAGWRRHTVWPWQALANSVHRVVAVHGHGVWELTALRLQAVMELLFAAVLVVAVVLLAIRRRWPEATFVGLTAASLLTSDHYLSVPRDVLTCFPVAVLAGEWLLRSPHRRDAGPRLRRAAVVTVSLAVAAFNALSLLGDHWAG